MTNLLTPFKNLFSFSSASGGQRSGTQPSEHTLFLANHTRKFILASFKLSSKQKPSVFVSICGLPDDIVLEPLLDSKNEKLWKNIAFISKYENTFSTFKLDDFIPKKIDGDVDTKNEESKICDISMDELLTIISKKNSFESVDKILSNSLFLFEGYNWVEILNCFKQANIEISPGIGNKRQLPNETQVKLLYSLLALRLNYDLIISYFYMGDYLFSTYKNERNYNEKSSIINENYFVPNKNYSTLTPNKGVKTVIKSNLASFGGAQSTRNFNKNLSFSNKNRSYSTTLDLEKKSLYFEYSPIFLNIEEILKNKSLDDISKQQRIEKLLNDTWLSLYTDKINSLDPFTKDYNSMLNKHLNEFRFSLEKYVDSLKIDTEIKHFKPIFGVSIDDMAKITFKVLVPILFSNEEHPKTRTIIKIGKAVFKKWAMLEYNKIKKCNPESTELDFHKFKDSLGFSDKDFLTIGDFLFGIVLNKSDIFEIRIDKSDPINTKLFIEPSYNTRKMLEKNMDVLGFKLPMTTPPVEWDSNIYGGYLLNNTDFKDSLIIPSKKSRIRSEIKNEVIYNSVNYMSEIPYKINKEVYEFILLHYKDLGLISGLHPDTKDYNKSSFSQKRKISSHNSLYYLHKNIMSLAKLYLNIEKFYFVLNLDWRGRLYCESSYLNFQGNELSKSLIKFANGGIIDEKGLFYLKVYGANCFGLGKSSFSERIQWVDENIENINNMNIDFINKASEPLLFIGFCIEFNNYLKDPDNFVSTLPILLDASCNGFQHLSAMIGESSIAKNVNLFETNMENPPMDFYQFSLDLINARLKELVAKDPLYIKLTKLNIPRKIIKYSIMTIPYNISKIGIVEQLEEHFEWVKIDNKHYLKPKWLEAESNIFLTKKELYKLASIIHSTLYDNHPKLKAFVEYLNEMAKVFHKLGLYLTWVTPSGLVVNQKYTKLKRQRVKPSLSSTNSNYTILIPTDNSDLSKQMAGFLPNLVHSLDAANICLMINFLIKNDNKINIFTVHDCFASTADSIELINSVVRYAFLMIYSDNQYIEKLHNYYIDMLSASFIIEDNVIITGNDEKIPIPTPPLSTDLGLRELLQKAVYFIH